MSATAGPDPAATPAPWPLPWLGHAWRLVVVWVLGAILWLSTFGTSPAAHPDHLAGDTPLGIVDGLLAVDLLLGQVAVVLAGWRRRRPVVIALLTAALTSLSVFASPAALLCLVSLAAHRRWRPVLGVGVSSLLTVTLYEALVAPVLSPDASRGIWLLVVVVTSGLMLAVAALWGWNLGGRRQLTESWRIQAETARREQGARTAQARLAERTRIAREMHDVLAHRISVMTMHAGALSYREDLSPQEVREAAETIRRNGHTALEELRATLGVLRAEDITEGPREAPQPDLLALPDLVAETERAGTPVRLRVPEDFWPRAVGLPARTGRHAYRVVQEALTNARKHAPGAVVDVVVDGDEARGLTLRIANPRVPGALRGDGSGFGLAGMRERVDLAGGRLAARDAGADFVVDAWLPWGSVEADEQDRPSTDGRPTAGHEEEER